MRSNYAVVRSHCAVGTQSLRSWCAAITQWCAAIAQWVRRHCAVGAHDNWFVTQSVRSHCAVGAQPLRSGCAAIAQWMRSNYAVNAQPLRSECAVIAQWVRSITHIDYAVLRSECAAVTQRYAVIPLCVMAGFTQITQSLRRRQLADVPFPEREPVPPIFGAGPLVIVDSDRRTSRNIPTCPDC